MTDNTGVSLTRDEAIDRMKAGLPCETYSLGLNDWRPTEWADFDSRADPMFRKPPESRRVAREWWISPSPKGTSNYDYAFSAQHLTGIHVREVLPGDVVCERMTWDNLMAAYYRATATSHHPFSEEGVIQFARALGLIGEGS